MVAQYINVQESIMVQFCGLCKEFPCEWLIQKVVWRQNVVEELTELANLYRQQN